MSSAKKTQNFVELHIAAQTPLFEVGLGFGQNSFVISK